MSYATLMVYVEADGTPEQRVRLAATLAEKFSAPLIGFSALAAKPIIGAESPVIVEVLDAEASEIRSKLSEREKWFRKIAGGGHHNRKWRSAVGYPTNELAREARSADLLIVGRSNGAGDLYSRLDLGGVVLRAGRPVLVVPDGIGSLRAERVVIGWKDTRESRRAVVDALPFLHEAARVSIVEICASGEEERSQEHLDDVARHLKQHRIDCGPRIVLHQKGSDAAQLIQLAQDDGADLLVTGGYGHSRMGEWMFGGMTRELLVSSPLCCLMSH
jgi:nucleotide-binding universal stress UspA family protein